MNRLRLAQQGFDSLATFLAVTLTEETSDRAEAWLRNEVCPVVEDLLANRSFRLAARWSVDHLEPGVDTQERRLVTAVDAALVSCAQRLLPLCARQESQGEGSHAPQSARVAISDSDRSSIELIARRPWFDLVCSEEYFHPTQSLHLLTSHPEHTTNFRRNELRVPLGDYVARSLFARIDYWKTILERVTLAALANLPPRLGVNPEGEALVTAKFALDEAVVQLTARCRLGNDPRVRDACATLVQVYAAYSALPNLDRLGCPAGSAAANRGLIRSCIRRRGDITTVQPLREGVLAIVAKQTASLCDPAVVRNIASALQQVAVFYDVPEDPDDLVEWCKDRTRLLMVDRVPRAVFWEGVPVAEDQWDEKPVEWNLLWTMAIRPRRTIDQAMLVRPEQHPIRSRRNRLSKMLQEALALDSLIENRRKLGYELDLEPAAIVLLHDDGLGRLRFQGHNTADV